mmetsp:Transcript_105718/g.340834  ORF Transcript_105718/g.340834 Transcript_105718/m.340834 type:complete len:331 (-) Transcript_105718:63-1055(-)
MPVQQHQRRPRQHRHIDQPPGSAACAAAATAAAANNAGAGPTAGNGPADTLGEREHGLPADEWPPRQGRGWRQAQALWQRRQPPRPPDVGEVGTVDADLGQGVVEKRRRLAVPQAPEELPVEVDEDAAHRADAHLGGRRRQPRAPAVGPEPPRASRDGGRGSRLQGPLPRRRGVRHPPRRREPMLCNRTEREVRPGHAVGPPARQLLGVPRGARVQNGVGDADGAGRGVGGPLGDHAGERCHRRECSCGLCLPRQLRHSLCPAGPVVRATLGIATSLAILLQQLAKHGATRQPPRLWCRCRRRGCPQERCGRQRCQRCRRRRGCNAGEAT